MRDFVLHRIVRQQREKSTQENYTQPFLNRFIGVDVSRSRGPGTAAAILRGCHGTVQHEISDRIGLRAVVRGDLEHLCAHAGVCVCV